MEDQEIISFYLDNEILISPDVLTELKEKPLPLKSRFTVLNKDILCFMNRSIQIEEFEKAIVLKEKHKNVKLYNKFIEALKENLTSEQETQENTQTNPASETNDYVDRVISSTSVKDLISKTSDDPKDSWTDEQRKEHFLKESRVRVVSSYNSKSRKWSVHDFVSLYLARFKELEKILRSRQELQNLTSILRITQKKERENVAIIGVVYEKGLTKTGNIMLTVEDPTGMIKVVVTKAKEELFRLAEEIQLDEVIGLTGMFDQIVFANNLFIPDIPLTKELRKSPEEGYFVVIADTEPGSKLFLEKEFDKFLSWLNGEVGNDKQKEVASKVKYLFIAGDLVNGVGIYPGQEFDLKIIDIRDQYKAFADLLKRIPENIVIFVCPGNHDVGRISEPQPALDKEYAESVVTLPNVVSVSNPSVINIYAQPENGFEGFDVMFYHGYSFIYYSENVPVIRKAGGQKRPDLIMKYLLQRRHLAPSHTSTLFIPDPTRDPLVIEKVPDFLITGHVHRATVSNYKNVTCINASCWTAQSEEQERRGLEAQPGRAFIVDMRTREVKIMNFLSKEDQDKETPQTLQANTQTNTTLNQANPSTTTSSQSSTTAPQSQSKSESESKEVKNG